MVDIKGTHDSSGGVRVLQFHDATFANIFHCRYNNHNDDQGSSLVRWTLDNDRLKRICNNEPQLLIPKSAAKVIDVQAFQAAADGALFDKAALSE